MKKVFTLYFIFLVAFVSAQNYYMSDGTDTTCSGNFYDSGGPSGNYGPNENSVKTFTSGGSQRVQVNFDMFDLDSYDYLRIYDGPSTSYPLMGEYRFSNSPGTVTSSGNALSFKFYSNNSIYNLDPGWAAQINCVGSVLPVFNMGNRTDTISHAVFYDHNGAASNYSDYESYTHSFKAASASFLNVKFNQTEFGISSGDTLWIYDGPDVNAPLLSVLVTGSKAEDITSSGDALTFRFKSDYASVSRGWQAEIIETNTAASPQYYDMSSGQRFICSGFFRDNGGSGNYTADQNLVQTFTSYSGSRIKFDFNMFDLDDYDYLRIYDGPSTSYPLIGEYRYSNSPGVVESSGKSLTFKFYSNNSVYNLDPGWQAQVSCTGPVMPEINMSNATDTVEELMFYDHEGANSNYAAYSDYVHTFTADTSQYLEVDFNQTGFGLATGDTLWIYDGLTTNAPLLAVLVNGSNAERRVSSGKSLTFRFKSDHSGESRGWQAAIKGTNDQPNPVYYDMSSGERFVCSGFFRDNGGSGNYTADKNLIQTFSSYSGDRIRFDFNMFNLGNYDYLRIYDGPSTAYPLVGEYRHSDSPGTVISTGKSLTFKFYSNNSTYNLGPGWEASISCAGPVLPVINMDNRTDTITQAMFSDHEGVMNHYSANADYTHTLISDTSQFLKMEFNQNGFGLSTGDTLWVFDGPDVSAPLLGVFVRGSVVEPRISSGNSLTFKFVSDNTGESIGWQAEINGTNDQPAPGYFDMSTGVRYMCQGFFRDNGGAGNYTADQNLVQTFTSYSGERIQFNFNMFDLDSYDYLRIYDGPSTSYPYLGEYRHSNSPGNVISSGKSLTFRFYSNSSTNNLGPGWEAQISCADTVWPVYLMNNATDTVSRAMFYDHEGPAGIYGNLQDYTHTFVADTAGHLKIRFNNLHSSLASGDTLWIFDGHGNNAPPVAVLVSGSVFEEFVSSSDAVTFRFKSDHTGGSNGWQAFIEQTEQLPQAMEYRISSGIRYTCDGIFRDHNGTSNYSNDEDYTQTFIANGGQRLKIVFNSFHTHNSYDYLKIYDGLNTSAPLLGTWSGGSGPGTVIASDSALTFVFHSNYTGTSSGWDAQFECININPPVVVSQPQNGQVCPGDSITFEVGAAGDSIQYQWKKNGNILAGETDSTLTINGVQSSDAGNYYCVVTNPYGTDSSAAASLNLHAVPLVSLSLSEVCDGQGTVALSGGSPAGGTYSGNFVSAGNFDLSASGTGDFEVHYTYTGTNGCTASASDTLHVKPLPGITFAPLPSKCMSDSPLTLSHAVPAGGTYYGTGVSGGEFDPATAGAGNHTVYYTYTGSNGCPATAQQSITVYDDPVVNLSQFSSVCVNGSTFPLTGGSPSGGSYSGPGVSNGVFDPALAGTGNHPIVYTYTNSNGCSGQDVKYLQVYSTPSVNLNLPSDLCIDNGPLNLTGGTPAGGTYSGTGVTNGVFYPSVAGAGTHIISYSYSDANSCNDTANALITVHNLPAVSLANLPAVCSNDSSFTLTGGSPAGGIYSGPGVNNGIFDPAAAGAGLHTITYTFTDSYGCSQQATSSVEVKEAPQPNISSIPSACEDAAAISLNASPSGGIFTGNGVSDSSFVPSAAGAGSHWIRYEYVAANGCVASDSTPAVVHELPVVDILNLDTMYCAYDSLIQLNGSPAGGSFTGAGISGSQFNPASVQPGYHTVSYLYTDNNGCSAADSQQVKIQPLPVLAFHSLKPYYCSADPADSLVASPAGGNYQGAGISGNWFIPAQAGTGAHPVTYSYTDVYGCNASVTDTVIVNLSPVIDLGADTSIKMSHALQLNTGGSFTDYLWFNASTGNSVNFDADSAGAGIHEVWLMVTDTNSCTDSDTVLVEVIDDTGIGGNTAGKIKVYPNPVSDIVNISFDNNCEADISLINLSGQLVKSGKVIGKTARINIEHLPSGVYLLIVNDKTLNYFKIVKE